ncbi:YtxH-like protein [Robiginitalea myxolifaciens]|uniref:YtxH-like protein n=1 Tax=Robiginitalea myxolifaciens TaxID=400055 RepID=A0A1I6HKG7_9FLAO|nr:YtxH domain-containing protein [Robiginitalea myxolifaciens]SFR54837.1 YtxH-like protein [Robiginitalea myxolifaciens]
MSNNTNTALGILAGTAIGATLGILFAPDKGSVTRRKISEKATETTDAIGAKAMEVKEAIVSSAQDHKASMDERISELVEDGSYKAEDLITALETKLEVLKKKNKNLRSA